jgi:prolyl oligopeptidase
MHRPQRALLALWVLCPLFASAQTQPPKTPVREVTDDYFGTKVVDPYRWLESTSDPEVIAWMKAQNDYTRLVLARIPGRDQLLGRIKALDNAGAVVSSLQVWGGHFFYLKTDPGSDNRKLYVRDHVNAPERLLVDPEELTTADGKHYSIDYFQPSPDGRYVAYGISLGGSEESVLHVSQSATGKALPDTIDRAQFAQPSWLPDGRSFFYTRTQKLGPDAPETARYQKLRVYRHALGADPDHEPLVFGYGVNSGVKVTEDDFPSIAFSPGAPGYLLGLVIHGVEREIDVYAIPFETDPWQQDGMEEDSDRGRRHHRIGCSWRSDIPALSQGCLTLQGSANQSGQSGPRTRDCGCAPEQSGRGQYRCRVGCALHPGPRWRYWPAAPFPVSPQRAGIREPAV